MRTVFSLKLFSFAFSILSSPIYAGDLNLCTISGDRPLLAASQTAGSGSTGTLAAPSLSVLSATHNSSLLWPSNQLATQTNESPAASTSALSALNLWGSFNINVHITCPNSPEVARTCTALAPHAAVSCTYADFIVGSSQVASPSLTVNVADTLAADVPADTNALPASTLILKQVSNTQNNNSTTDNISRMMVHGNQLTFMASAAWKSKLFAVETNGTLKQVSNFSGWSDYIDAPAYSSTYGLISLASPNSSTTRKLMAYTPAAFKQLSATTYATGSFMPIGDFGGNFYFVGKNSGGYFKLYRYNGTQVTQITDIRGSSASDFPSVVSPGAVFNSKLYFRAYNSNGYQKLYSFDGTAIKQITNINGNFADDLQAGDPAPVVLNSKLYLHGRDASNFATLISYDGSSVKKILGISPIVSSYPLTVFNGALYVAGQTPKRKLYKYDGTNLIQLSWNGAAADDLDWSMYTAIYGNRLYFTAWNASGKRKLFATDGTEVYQALNVNGAGTDDVAGWGAGLATFSSKLYLTLQNASGVVKLYSVCDSATGCTP